MSQSTVVRADAGCREELGFWGEPAQQVFAAVTRPEGTAIGAAVLCPSLFTEHVAGYPQEVWLARALADRGVVTARLHYRGTGHSEGAGDELDVDAMVEDVVATAERLASDADGPPVLVGTRFGALVATAASTALGGTPLVLYEPCLDGARFLADLLRVRRMREVLRGERQPAAAADLIAELDGGGTIDVLGFQVAPRWWHSVTDRSLDALLADPARPTYVVVPKSGARGEVEALVQARIDRGWPVEAVEGWDPHDWWLMKPRPAPDDERMAPLVAWIAESAS